MTIDILPTLAKLSGAALPANKIELIVRPRRARAERAATPAPATA